MTSLLSPADIAELEAFEDENGGYYHKMAAWLDNFIQAGVEADRFTEAEAKADLQIALWYAYANNNADDYACYWKTVQWLPDSEANAHGCGAWYYRYSVALMYCGLLEEARYYAEAGAQEEPDYPWVWLQVAKLRSHFGDKDGALAAVEHGLELVPGDYEFSTLCLEIEEGATLEQMEYHLIKPDDDRQLQEGLDPNADNKLQAISCIRVNEAGLMGFRMLFKLKELEHTRPYCTFHYPIQRHDVQMVFYMNEAGLSKIRLDWLKQQKQLLDESSLLSRPEPDGSRAMLQAVLFYLDYQVMLVYWNPETDEEFMLPLVEAAAAEAERPKPCA